MPVPVVFEDVAGTAQIQVNEREVLYPANSVVLLKPGYPAPDLHITAPFQLGIITEDVVKDDHCYSLNVPLFLPSFYDCLAFCPQANITVHRDAVAMEVETAKVIHSDDDKLITLSDEDFSTLVRYLHKDGNEEESCQERDHNDSESKEGQDDFVLVDSRVILRQSRQKTTTPRFIDFISPFTQHSFLGMALLNVGTLVDSLGDGPLDFCRVNANVLAHVTRGHICKTFRRAETTQEVISAGH